MSEKQYALTKQQIRDVFRRGANIDPGESMVKLEQAVIDAYTSSLPTVQAPVVPNVDTNLAVHDLLQIVIKWQSTGNNNYHDLESMIDRWLIAILAHTPQEQKPMVPNGPDDAFNAWIATDPEATMLEVFWAKKGWDAHKALAHGYREPVDGGTGRCVNCGKPEGLHRDTDDACPRGYDEPNEPYDLGTTWRKA